MVVLRGLTCHTLAQPSSATEATLWFALKNATPRTRSLCPSRAIRQRPLGTSHNFTELSVPPDTAIWSSMESAAQTQRPPAPSSPNSAL